MKKPTFSSALVKALGCVLLIGMAAVILFPVFARSRGPRQFSCLSNMKLLALAMRMYAEDCDERLPAGPGWMDATYPYTRNETLFVCPAVKTTGSGFVYGYAYNSVLARTHLPKASGSKVAPLLYDSSNLVRSAFDPVTSLANPPRHAGRNVIAFTDGHAKAMTPREFGDLVRKRQK